MPATLQDIEQARAQTKAASQRATSSTAFGEDFMSRVKANLRKRSESRGADVISKMASSARQQYANAPNEAAEAGRGLSYSRIKGLQDQAKGVALSKLQEASDLRTRQMEDINSIFTDAESGIKASAIRDQGEADVASQYMNDLVTEYQLAETAKQREFENNLALQEMAIAQSAADAANGDSDDDVRQYMFDLYNQGLPINDIMIATAGAFNRTPEEVKAIFSAAGGSTYDATAQLESMDPSVRAFTTAYQAAQDAGVPLQDYPNVAEYSQNYKGLGDYVALATEGMEKYGRKSSLLGARVLAKLFPMLELKDSSTRGVD